MDLSLESRLLIVGLLIGILVLDWVYLRKAHRRVFSLEIFGFSLVSITLFFPEIVISLADTLGIGRGVDLLIYPLLIWLFREAVLSRVRYFKLEQEISKLVQLVAVQSAEPKVEKD
jgi:hypothetical protein